RLPGRAPAPELRTLFPTRRSSDLFDVKRVQGAAGYASNAGLFNCVFTGRGRIALTTEGGPVVLNVDQPTYADPQAAVAWSSSLRSEEHTSELQSRENLVCRLLLEK